jgi:hypothetical protein
MSRDKVFKDAGATGPAAADEFAAHIKNLIFFILARLLLRTRLFKCLWHSLKV